MISREELFGGTAVTPMLLERQPVAREPTLADTYDENKLFQLTNLMPSSRYLQRHPYTKYLHRQPYAKIDHSGAITTYVIFPSKLSFT